MTFMDVGRDGKPDYINLSHVSRVEYGGRYHSGPAGEVRVHVSVYYETYDNDYPVTLVLSDKQWDEIRKKLSQ